MCQQVPAVPVHSVRFQPDPRVVQRYPGSIRPRFQEQEWSGPEVDIILAIVASYSSKGPPERPFIIRNRDDLLESFKLRLRGDKHWNLKECLKKSSRLWADLPNDARNETVQRLEDKLKLRMASVLAYLAIGPDSSDVYDHRDSEVEMPMI